MYIYMRKTKIKKEKKKLKNKYDDVQIMHANCHALILGINETSVGAAINFHLTLQYDHSGPGFHQYDINHPHGQPPPQDPSPNSSFLTFLYYLTFFPWLSATIINCSSTSLFLHVSQIKYMHWIGCYDYIQGFSCPGDVRRGGGKLMIVVESLNVFILI